MKIAQFPGKKLIPSLELKKSGLAKVLVMCQHFGERKPDQEDFCKDARLSLTISVGADEFAMDKYAWLGYMFITDF